MKTDSLFRRSQLPATERYIELDHWSLHTHTLRDNININVILPPKQRHCISATFLHTNSSEVMPIFTAVLSIIGKHYDTFGWNYYTMSE